GQPEGRSELERMADVDGAVALDDTMIYANSFKSRTLAIDGPSGRPMWQSDHGGAGAIGVAPSALVVSTAAGSVYALDKNNGVALWSQPALARRSVTGPAVHGDYAVVGDYAGYVHWLRMDNGEMAAREKVGRKPAVKAARGVSAGLLLVQDVTGGLTAFRLDGPDGCRQDPCNATAGCSGWTSECRQVDPVQCADAHPRRARPRRGRRHPCPVL